MLKEIIIILISVSVFGVLLFLYVKSTLEKKLNYYLSKKNKKR